MNVAALTALLEPVLTAHRLELDNLEVVGAGGRSVLRITVDGDGPKGRGPLLDDVAEATRSISDALDASDLTGTRPYVLEVSSRGVGAPLTKPQHWRRNAGRLVEVTATDGTKTTGRIVSADDDAATLETGTVAYADVKKAVIQVELNRKPDPELDLDEVDEDELDDDLDDDTDDEE